MNDSTDTINEMLMGEVYRLLQEGKEQEAADMIPLISNQGKWKSSHVLQMVYEKFSDMGILYRCIIDTYTHDGYNFPKRIMIKAKKIAPTMTSAERWGELPPGDLITVYRAASTPISTVRNDLSWTIKKDVAVWFANKEAHLPPLHVYQGQIQRDKIIAYTSNGTEYEVIQHGSVKDIVELSITADDVKVAMDWKKRSSRSEG